MGDRDAVVQFDEILNDHVAVTDLMIPLEAEQADTGLIQLAGQCEQTLPRAILQSLAINLGATLDIARPVPISILFRIAERTDVAVLNVLPGQCFTKCRLREAPFSRKRQLPDIDQPLDPGLDEITEKLIDRPSLVTDSEKFNVYESGCHTNRVPDRSMRSFNGLTTLRTMKEVRCLSIVPTTNQTSRSEPQSCSRNFSLTRSFTSGMS